MFKPPDPLSLVPSDGFSAGVITVRWKASEGSYVITGRDGRCYVADITIDKRGQLDRDLGTKALQGLIVRAPDGSLARIAGVESFATTGLHGPVGLLLVPVDEC